MVRSGLRLLLLVLAFGLGGPASAQAPPSTPGTIYRVFLSDGQALPSYGEAARVDDRIVFNLLIQRTGADQELQLVSLPASSVDVGRTTRYAEAMRASFYAATRGDADYKAMTADVARTLEAIGQSTDLRARLQLAEQARQRLITWSREHYGYREGDVRELVELFDALLTELRAGTKEMSLAFDLVAGPGTTPREPLLPAPTLRESILLAVSAAAAADIPEERRAILQRAARAAAALPDAALAARIEAELSAEARAAAAYRALAEEVNTRATAALRDGDVAGVERLRAELLERDRALGSRRPQEVAGLLKALQEKLEAARAYRVAIDHYTYVRASLLAYERRIRPSLSGLDGLRPVLQYVRDGRSMAFDRIETAVDRLERFDREVGTVTPPEDLAGVHATLVSAVRMAREAVTRRRLAVIANNVLADREASAAAAGALLLVDRTRADLVEGLYPPKPQPAPVAAPGPN